MRGNGNHYRHGRGFTFVEILAAMVFMALVIPVAVHGIMVINRTAEVATRKKIAVELGDKMLAESVATEAWRNGVTNGDFGEETPGYRYEMTTANWSEAALTVLTVKVFYTVQGSEYSEQLDTLALTNEEDATPTQ